MTARILSFDKNTGLIPCVLIFDKIVSLFVCKRTQSVFVLPLSAISIISTSVIYLIAKIQIYLQRKSKNIRTFAKNYHI